MFGKYEARQRENLIFHRRWRFHGRICKCSYHRISVVRKCANFSLASKIRDTQRRAQKFSVHLTKDDSGEKFKILILRKVRVILFRITIIFQLVASRRFDFDSRNFDYRVFIQRLWGIWDGNRMYSSRFLIIRPRKHHREIITAERNVPRWHRRSYGGG